MQPRHWKSKIRVGQWTVYGLMFVPLCNVGCSALYPDKNKKSPEYIDAKNAIESYEDEDGNYIRPEGLKAEKRGKRGSTGILSSSKNPIPFLGGKPLDRNKAREVFAEGDALFQQASAATGEQRKDLFNEAAKKYKLAAKYWPSSALEQDAWMMAGESRFFAEEYPEAEEFYVKLLRDYPRTRYLDAVDKRRMEIALYWIRYDREDPKAFYVMNFTDDRRPWNDTGNHGVRVLEKLRLDDPTGRFADDATMELANAAFQKKNYGEAADLYGDLRSTYPNSKHQFDAHFLGLKSTLLTYKSAQYDGQALVDSEKLIKQIMKQFPEEAKAQKEYLNRTYAEIRYKNAERLMTKADFRMKRGENRAASIYLDELMTEYSDTPFMQVASAERMKIGELAPEPTQHLKWLADLVPHNDKVSQIQRQVDPVQSPDLPLPDAKYDSQTQIATKPNESSNLRR